MSLLKFKEALFATSGKKSLFRFNTKIEKDYILLAIFVTSSAEFDNPVKAENISSIAVA